MFNMQYYLSAMLTAEAVHLTTIADSCGAPLAGYFFSGPSLALHHLARPTHRHRSNQGACWKFRACWKGHAFQRVLDDKRDTGGDWSEALPWLEYE